MPKSKVTKRAKRKKEARRKQKQARVHVSELVNMINALDTYETHLAEEPIEIDGEVYMNPYQAAAIEQLNEGETKEKEDGR